jgi:hypothetical protein
MNLTWPPRSDVHFRNELGPLPVRDFVNVSGELIAATDTPPTTTLQSVRAADVAAKVVDALPALGGGTPWVALKETPPVTRAEGEHGPQARINAAGFVLMRGRTPAGTTLTLPAVLTPQHVMWIPAGSDNNGVVNLVIANGGTVTSTADDGDFYLAGFEYVPSIGRMVIRIIDPVYPFESDPQDPLVTWGLGAAGSTIGWAANLYGNPSVFQWDYTIPTWGGSWVGSAEHPTIYEIIDGPYAGQVGTWLPDVRFEELSPGKGRVSVYFGGVVDPPFPDNFDAGNVRFTFWMEYIEAV